MHFNQKWWFVVLWGFMPLVSIAQSRTISSYAVDFKIKNAGFNVNGSFGKMGGTLVFDPQKPTEGSLDAWVEVGSINTGIAARDRHLQADEYFDTANYAYITMKSTRLAWAQGGGYLGYFKLTIKGTTQDITLPFSFENNTFKTEFTINRRDFYVGGGSMILGNEVTIYLSVQVQ